MASVTSRRFLFLGGLLLFIAAVNGLPRSNCGSFTDRQMAMPVRIREFLECLGRQGHDEEILLELKKTSSDNRLASSRRRSAINCGQLQLDDDDDGSIFPYCSGMTSLECKTLILVLENLLNIPGTLTTNVTRVQQQRMKSASLDADENVLQEALLNVLLARFNDILDEYKDWRVDHPLFSNYREISLQKRSIGDETAKEDDILKKASLKQPDEKTKMSKSSSADDLMSRSSSSSSPPPPSAAKVRIRRQPTNHIIPFKLPDKLTPEMQAVLEGYLAWREKNPGYGKMSGRWG